MSPSGVASSPAHAALRGLAWLLRSQRSMRFLLPHALWLLLLAPLCIWAYVALRARRHSAVRYSSLVLIREALTQGQRIRPHIPAIVFLAALCACVIAVARPTAMITTPADLRTIILAIDVSLSMAAEDVQPSRLAAAQAAARTFVTSQPRDVRIGVVAFAGNADLVQPPTSDRGKLFAAIDHLELQHSTGIGIGVIASLMTIAPNEGIPWTFDIFGTGRAPVASDPLRLDRSGEGDVPPPQLHAPGSHPSAAIVVLTDGRDTLGPPVSMAAKLAADRGVRVYTVGFGKRDGAFLRTSHQDEGEDVRLDEAALKELAAKTSGEYFHASTAHELKNVYRKLESRIVLERAGMEMTAVATAAAALLLLAAGALSMLWAPRLQ